jgi:hypothetical protein
VGPVRRFFTAATDLDAVVTWCRRGAVMLSLGAGAYAALLNFFRTVDPVTGVLLALGLALGCLWILGKAVLWILAYTQTRRLPVVLSPLPIWSDNRLTVLVRNNRATDDFKVNLDDAASLGLSRGAPRTLPWEGYGGEFRTITGKGGKEAFEIAIIDTESLTKEGRPSLVVTVPGVDAKKVRCVREEGRWIGRFDVTISVHSKGQAIHATATVRLETTLPEGGVPIGGHSVMIVEQEAVGTATRAFRMAAAGAGFVVAPMSVDAALVSRSRPDIGGAESPPSAPEGPET